MSSQPLKPLNFLKLIKPNKKRGSRNYPRLLCYVDRVKCVTSTW